MKMGRTNLIVSRIGLLRSTQESQNSPSSQQKRRDNIEWDLKLVKV